MENTENNDLFNISFDSISDDAIEMSDIMAEEKPEVVEVEVEDTPIQEPIASEEEATEEKEEKEEPSKADIIDIDEQEEDDSTEDKDPGSEEKSSSPVTPFAALLHERGFLPNFDEDAFNEAIEQSDDHFGVLAQAMKYELDIANSNFINSFPPELIDMAKAVAAGVPFEALRGPKLQEIAYDKLDDDAISENEDLQKKLISDYYHTKGFSDKKIEKLLTTLGDSGGLADEALEAREELEEQAKEKQEQIKKQYASQQKQFQEQHAAQINYIGNTIAGIEEIIPGVKVTKNVKDRLFGNMTQMVGKDQNGNPINFTMALRQQNPVHFDLAVTYLADITKGFSDWSKLGKAAKSNATQELEKSLRSSGMGGGSGAPKKVKNSEKAEDALMSSLNSMFNKK